MMMLLWTALLFLPPGDALFSVATVELGEPANFKCFYSDVAYSIKKVKWYKQTIGDTLVLITILTKPTDSPSFERGFPSSRFAVNHTGNMSTLSISRTIPGDAAIYHCEVVTWRMDQWSGTYLSLTGRRRPRGYTVVQSDGGDGGGLQCSVLSGPEEACPAGHRVLWLQVHADTSSPKVIYTAGHVQDECVQEPAAEPAVRRCVYHLPHNISHADAGSYYCAVAACGEIMFGDGTKLDIAEIEYFLPSHNLMPLLVISAVCVTVIAIAIYSTKKSKGDNRSSKAVSQQENAAKRNLKRDEDMWIYSTVAFTVVKGEDVKAENSQKIYAADC